MSTKQDPAHPGEISTDVDQDLDAVWELALEHRRSVRERQRRRRFRRLPPDRDSQPDRDPAP